MSRWNAAFQNQNAVETIQKTLDALTRANPEKFSADDRAEYNRAIKVLFRFLIHDFNGRGGYGGVCLDFS